MSRRRVRRAKRQRRRIIIASVAVGSALFAFVSTVVNDGRHSAPRELFVEREVAGGTGTPNVAQARGTHPVDAIPTLASDPQALDSGLYGSIDYITSNYDPLYSGLDESPVTDPDDIDGLGPNADDGYGILGTGPTQNISMNVGARSKRASRRRGQGSGGGGTGFGGFGAVGGGVGAGPASGESGPGLASSEQPIPRSLFTGLNPPGPENDDSISQEVAALGAPNFASLPANFDPCQHGGLVVSPCVSPAIDPCPSDGSGAASCSSGDSGSDVQRSVASVNGRRSGATDSDEGSGSSGSRQSGENSEGRENVGGSEDPDDRVGTGGNGGGDEGFQIAAIAGEGGEGSGKGTQSSADESQTSTDDDETRSPYASTDLRPLLISGGVNPDPTQGGGADEDEEGSGGGGSDGNSGGALTTASTSTAVPVPAPALLLSFGIALLMRRR